MSRAPAKAVQMACLTIGHYDYLLPSAKAMKVAELMQDAFECREHYDGGTSSVYEVKADQPNVEFKLVRPNQVRMPHGETAAIPSKPRQLR
ncbi:hypothetical protein N5D77_05910 [Comamonas thiooxydans]|uniref:Uncharacterized protein n=1 Tax=Comamonas thiooxydans TaxID=363952 RepID=A0AA42PY87_9BURK|nr:MULTISPECIES: hypothetical protein [Comamonas]MDH1333234.1 hypothetical protein [Comamonas thiooxydans]MDH1738993.1 hypothetical protein [Comamonas thiooxydans]MDH1786104.1 hypothetical protein [Comamonas thiooxydans]MPS95008.1 hypothetical protein [Comamonas sp.]